MKLSEIKQILPALSNVAFTLPDGSFVPSHFHVTEIGLVTKNFIDCGGKLRNETTVNFQLWNANDLEHNLKPTKLLKIIELSEQVLALTDDEIEVEYQTQTIGKYSLGFDGTNFNLIPKNTACLAMESCGTTSEPSLVVSSDIETCCAPGGGCC